LAEHGVKDDEIVDGCTRVADAFGELVGGLNGKARSIEAVVDGDIARRQGARRRVLQDLPNAKVLEEIAGIGLGHHDPPILSIASAMATVRGAISAWRSSTMRPSTLITPLPLASGSANAAMILRAKAISAAGGANTSLAAAIWSGWIKVLPSKPRRRP